jgi:hypothetical protein
MDVAMALFEYTDCSKTYIRGFKGDCNVLHHNQLNLPCATRRLRLTPTATHTLDVSLIMPRQIMGPVPDMLDKLADRSLNLNYYHGSVVSKARLRASASAHARIGLLARTDCMHGSVPRSFGWC